MIAIIIGTNRNQSVSRVIAQQYQRLLKEQQTESMLLDLNQLPSDFTETALYENTGKNQVFNGFQRVIDENDKFVFIIPEYNGSYPGVLKAFIDGLKYPNSFSGKKAGLVGVSSGAQGGALALSHFNDVLSYLGTHTLAMRVKLAKIKDNLKDGELTNPLYTELLQMQARQLVAF